MSDDNHETKVTEKASEVAKNIWLAGLGAYGKAFDEAHERYEKVSKETSRMFDELVSKGKRLEDETQDKISEAREKSTTSIEDRIARVRQSLGFGEKNVSIDELNKKVDELSEKLDMLIDAVGVQTKSKKAAKSSSASE